MGTVSMHSTDRTPSMNGNPTTADAVAAYRNVLWDIHHADKSLDLHRFIHAKVCDRFGVGAYALDEDGIPL